MSSIRNGLRLGVPAGWGDVLISTLKVALVAFLTLVVKEWVDTRELDLRACAIDGSWIAGGILLVNTAMFVLIPAPKTRTT